MIAWTPTELETLHNGTVYTARCHSNIGNEAWTVMKRSVDQPNIPPMKYTLTENGWEYLLTAKGKPRHVTRTELDNLDNL